MLNAIKNKEIITDIDNLVWKYDISYMEATILYCEENSIEIEVVAKYIKQNDLMKGRIQDEAEALRFLPKTGKLEF